jgi:hypothetical protein
MIHPRGTASVCEEATRTNIQSIIKSSFMDERIAPHWIMQKSAYLIRRDAHFDGRRTIEPRARTRSRLFSLAYLEAENSTSGPLGLTGITNAS